MLNLYLTLIDDDEDKIRFTKLYEQYRHLMFYIAQEILKDEHLSEDAVNEDAALEETTINGCKGYRSSKDGTTALYWASGTYFYELQGTCNMDILWQMAESMTN